MADSISPRFPRQELHSTTHSKPTCKNRSFSPTLGKSLIFLIFLVAIPLFPSQAPNFINQTPLFTKFWELVHLLFIGVAVCYGLFSGRRTKRTNFDVDLETHSTVLDDSLSSYVSRIFHVSPIFEDRFDSSCGSYDKNVYQSWNSLYYGDGGDQPMVVSVGHDGSLVGEQRKSRLLYSENGLQASFEHEDNHLIEAWNFQYSFWGDSTAVVSPPNCVADEYGENGRVIGHKSLLGLPVRSLNSRDSNEDSPQLSNETGSNSSLKGLSNSSSSEKSTDEAKFGDMGPLNLEERFNDTVPWRSTSVNMEMREKVGSVANGISHLRPISVDETQFDSVKSHSLRSTTSLSSQSSSATCLPARIYPSHSIASELPNSEAEELGKNTSYRASYPPASQSPQTTMNSSGRLNAFHLRRYSSGSLFQKDLQKNWGSDLKNLGGNVRDVSSSSIERRRGSLKLDKKPTAPVKGSSMGKSVRTIRASGYTSGAKREGGGSKNHVEDPIGEQFDEAKAGKSEIRRPDKMSIGANKPHLRKPTLEKYNKERKEAPENVAVVSESEADSSNEDAVIDTGCHAGDDLNEVDKKAGEFIAKFREQIRLQKVDSMERSRRFRRSRNHI